MLESTYSGEKCFQACSFMIDMERSMASVLTRKEILTVKETSLPVRKNPFSLWGGRQAFAHV